MSKIRKRDTDGVKPLLDKAEFGYDDYQDKGRVYIGTGSENIGLAKKSEVDNSDSIITAHKNDKNNPHNVTKAQVGLNNVDNTSDVNKPISSATQTALDTKVSTNSNQTIAGIKTFSSNPISTATQNTAVNALTRKDYVDSLDNTNVKLTGDQTVAGVKTFSSPITGSISGNSATATKLATARTINGVPFDGTTNITVVDSTKAPLSHNHDASHINTGTLSVDRLPTIPNTKISGLGTASTRNVGVGAGNVMEVGSYGIGQNGTDTELQVTAGDSSILDYMNVGPYGMGVRSFRTDHVNTSYTKAWQPNLVWGAGDAAILLSTGISADSIKISQFNTNGVHLYSYILSHSGNLQTETGQSTEYPMTQKAVTDAIQGVSDARDKTNIQNTDIGLELIEKLNVVTYNLNKREWYRSEEATITEEIELEDGTKNTTTRVDDKILKTDLKKYDKNDGHLAKNSIYTGLIAQDVKEAYESLGLDLSIVKNMKDEYEGGDDKYYIEYNGVIPLLINAIKELNNKVKTLEDKLKTEGGN